MTPTIYTPPTLDPSPGPDRLRHLPRAGFAFGLLTALVLSAPLLADDFTVTSSGDQGDANPGNGFCATPGMFSACTLRAAVEEANALPGLDRIFFNGGGTINLGTQLLIDDDLIIQGNGAMIGATRTLLKGVGGERVFDIDQFTVVTISDLAIGSTDAGMNRGGAIRNAGELLLERVEVGFNEAISCGGVESFFETTIRDSTFVRNVTTGAPGLGDGYGGALCVRGGSLATITNSTFHKNRGRVGASISVEAGALLNVYSSTFADNEMGHSQSTPATAIWAQDATVRIDKNIFLGGGACHYDNVTLLSDGGNRESPGDTCLGPTAGDQPNLTRHQVALGPLDDWGGPVETMLPGTWSAAVDPPLSFASCTPLDARGEPRFGACDVGAAERQIDDPESALWIFVDDFETGNLAAWSSTSP